MRMDHYVRIGDNDIHAAQLIYSIGTIIVLSMLCSIILRRNITNDLKAVQLGTIFRR